MFFFEKKNQKTFTIPPLPPSPAMAGICTLAQTQKSFGSFLQKRTASFLMSDGGLKPTLRRCGCP
jgi:hypothetical protein